MDEVVREIFTRHPSICWEMRNRISYDDMVPQDPEETEEEDHAHLFSDSEEDIESALERQMQDEIDHDNGYF